MAGSNQYYNHSTQLIPGTKARSADVNSRLDGVATGLDKLPDPHASAPTTKGFSEVFEIVDAAAAGQPASAGQVQKNNLCLGADTGAANAYVVALSPALTAYTAGQVIWFVPDNDNTGACTVNVNGLGVKNLKYANGSDIASGEIKSGGAVCAMYDGTSFRLISAAVELTTRAEEAATAAEEAAATVGYFIKTNTTLYLAANGNDTTGDGSSGSPWRTVAKAMDYLSDKIICSTAHVTISLAAGTYTNLTGTVLEHQNLNRVTIVGAGASTILEFSSGASGFVFSTGANLHKVQDLTMKGFNSTSGVGLDMRANNTSIYTLQGVTLENWKEGGILMWNNSSIYIVACDFTNCLLALYVARGSVAGVVGTDFDGQGSGNLVEAASGGRILMYSNVTLADASIGIYAEKDSFVDADGVTSNTCTTGYDPVTAITPGFDNAGAWIYKT